MIKPLCVAAALALTLTGCETVGSLLGAGGFFDEAATKWAEIADSTIEKAATAYEIYCEKTPDSGRDLVRDKFNAKTNTYDMPDICQPNADPVE
jgi:hypothetical protein